jgi:hypothetical protein
MAPRPYSGLGEEPRGLPPRGYGGMMSHLLLKNTEKSLICSIYVADADLRPLGTLVKSTFSLPRTSLPPPLHTQAAHHP